MVGKVGNAHLEQPMEAMEFIGRRLVFTEPVIVDVAYSFDGEGFSLKGELSSELLMNCTKCNTEFPQRFSIDFSERFLKVSPEEAEDMECYPFTGDKLNLDKMVEDLIFLNAPMYGLCRPDCRGFCSTCGVNLNITQCSCSDSAENVAFASLKELAQLLKDD